MCHAVLQDRNFYSLLERADEELAAEVQAAGCCCGGRLHSARYPRKPRGEPRCGAGDAAVKRHSFCCAQCRRRRTPMSVRFLGRRVYWAAVVLLATALAHGFSDRRLAQLKGLLGVPARTLLRWRDWWRTQFIVSFFLAANSSAEKLDCTVVLRSKSAAAIVAARSSFVRG